MVRTIFDVIHEHPDDFTPTRQPTPTDTRPGSAEKLRILIARAERGEGLFHPDDRHCFPPTIYGRTYADVAFAPNGRLKDTTDMITFTVNAVPVAQPRPRVVNVAGKARAVSAPTLHPVNAFKATCRQAAASAYDGPPLNYDVTLQLLFVMPRPQKRDGLKHADDGRYPHCKRPDLDNCTKSFLDALSGLLWTDDSVISNLQAAKVVAGADEQPHVEVGVSGSVR